MNKTASNKAASRVAAKDQNGSYSAGLGDRVAFTVAEFSKLFGRHVSWGHRRLYHGDVCAITQFGRLLIPAQEVQRVLATAKRYDQLPADDRKEELSASH